jgi:hypothetical protein
MAILNYPSAIGNGLFNALPADAQGVLTAFDGLAGTPFIFNAFNGLSVTAAWMIMNTIPTAVSYIHTAAAAYATAPAAAAGDVVPIAGGITGGGALVNSVSGAGAAGALGEASAVGGLSVPASWSSATPATLASSTAPLEGSGWAVGQEAAGTGTVVPGMPGMVGAAKGGAFAGPRYGVKPIVMPKPVVV